MAGKTPDLVESELLLKELIEIERLRLETEETIAAHLQKMSETLEELKQEFASFVVDFHEKF